MNLHRPKDHVINHRMIENTFINIFDEEMHAKRVLSLSNAVQGVLHGTSLAIQGMQWYNCIPNMPEHRLGPLMDAFARTLMDHKNFNEMFFVV